MNDTPCHNHNWAVSKISHRVFRRNTIQMLMFLAQHRSLHLNSQHWNDHFPDPPYYHIQYLPDESTHRKCIIITNFKAFF